MTGGETQKQLFRVRRLFGTAAECQIRLIDVAVMNMMQNIGNLFIVFLSGELRFQRFLKMFAQVIGRPDRKRSMIVNSEFRKRELRFGRVNSQGGIEGGGGFIGDESGGEEAFRSQTFEFMEQRFHFIRTARPQNPDGIGEELPPGVFSGRGKQSRSRTAHDRKQIGR